MMNGRAPIVLNQRIFQQKEFFTTKFSQFRITRQVGESNYEDHMIAAQLEGKTTLSVQRSALSSHVKCEPQWFSFSLIIYLGML